ncbi:MAG TPA: hypothetical protein VF494_09835 [Candidatus Limnocylindrales bacterium]
MRVREGHVRLAGVLLPLVVAMGGCGPSAVATETASASVSAVAAQPTSPPTTEPSSTAAKDPTPGGSAASAVAVDANLLRVLPAQIGGVALEPDPTTAAQIAVDPSLAGSAQAIAVALAIRSGTSSGDDLAIVSVIRLRPGIFTDSWYQAWRSTYDRGACDVAGGVKGAPSETSIGGRTVFVGTCAGDARTYHVHLADLGLLVSVTAAGPARFGELVVGGLAE